RGRRPSHRGSVPRPGAPALRTQPQRRRRFRAADRDVSRAHRSRTELHGDRPRARTRSLDGAAGGPGRNGPYRDGRRGRRDGTPARVPAAREGGMKHVAALVVTGGRGVLAELGAPEDAALTPFAGTYRFIDFALAAAVNAGISAVRVTAWRP